LEEVLILYFILSSFSPPLSLQESKSEFCNTIRFRY
jgi:hypothetical protein